MYIAPKPNEIVFRCLGLQHKKKETKLLSIGKLMILKKKCQPLKLFTGLWRWWSLPRDPGCSVPAGYGS